VIVPGGLAAAAVLAGLALVAPASPVVKPPRGIPDLASMALRVSDLPAGARVKHQGYVRTSSVAEYDREFATLTARVGSKRLLGLENDIFLERAASIAAAEFAQLRRVLGTKRGRQAVAASLKKAVGSDADFVRVSTPFGLGAGQESIGLTLTIGTFLGTFQAELGFVRVDRVVATVVFEAQPDMRLTRADMARLARPVGTHMAAGLLPVSAVPPLVSGNPIAGQPLAAVPGSWRNGPLSFAYQWQRCDPAGAACVDISGATASTYVLLDDDAGSTVRVGVTATNSVGSTASVSAPTGVVAPLAGAPVNIVLPSISGAAAQGQTLTAATGTWVGAPTGFTYQWQRCDAAGAGCIAIDGATAATYVVGAADAGGTLRVVVTATNASGSTSAVSPPTTTVG
jgi:hypothetical protein